MKGLTTLFGIDHLALINTAIKEILYNHLILLMRDVSRET